MKNNNELRLDWDYSTNKIIRKYENDDNFGFIDINKLPEIITLLMEKYSNQIEYIKLLHNKMDDIFMKNKICNNEFCHRAGCDSEHK